MIFRWREQPTIGHEERLRALGTLLDERGYERDGLCILSLAGGYEVTGLRVPQRGAAYDLEQQTELFANTDLDDLALRAQDEW
jgi:hypothetical protein